MARLVERLQTAQEALGDTDEVFATRIGVSRALWSMVKSGTARFGYPSVLKIRRFAPGLRDDTEQYLESAAGGTARVKRAA